MVEILEGIFVENETAKALGLVDFREAEAKRRRESEIREELCRWLSAATGNEPEYSDIYKEVYGVRPR